MSMIDSRLGRRSPRRSTPGCPGLPVVVFNPLGWERSDIVEVDLGFARGGRDRDRRRSTSAGKDVPVQIDAVDALRRRRPEDGAGRLRRPRRPGAGLPDCSASCHATGPTRHRSRRPPTATALENDSYRVTFDPAHRGDHQPAGQDGRLGGLLGPGQRRGATEDRGDLWELYRGLDGGSKIAMTTRQEVPKRGTGRTSATSSRASPATLRAGPGLLRVPGRRTRSTRDGSRRPSGSTPDLAGSTSDMRLVNNEKYVRYQALFPTTIKNGQERSRDPLRRDRAPGRHRVPRPELGRSRRRRSGGWPS